MSTQANWYPILPDPPQPPDLDYGSTILGDSAPTNDIGVDGDIFVLRDGSAIWIKDNGAWVSVATGIGPASQEIFVGNWGGGYPTAVPLVAQAKGVDTSDGTDWDWYGGAWH